MSDLLERLKRGPVIKPVDADASVASAPAQAPVELPGFTITLGCPWLSDPSPWQRQEVSVPAPPSAPAAVGGCRPCVNGVADYEATITVTRNDGTPLPDGTRVDVYAITNGTTYNLGTYYTQNSAITVRWASAPPSFDLQLILYTPWQTTEILIIRGVVNCCVIA